MDQKITARAALTIGVDPVNDVLPIVDISAGASGSKKITINDLFTGWGMTPAGAALVKATDVQSQRAALGVNQIYYNPAITGLTGGTSNRLDAVPTVNLAVGSIHIVFLANTRIHFFKLVPGDFIEEEPRVVVPDDSNPSTNSKAWFLTSAAFDHLEGTQFDAQYINAYNLSVANVLGANVITSDSQITANNLLPLYGGRIALEPIVNFFPVTSPYTFYGQEFVDQTFILEPTSAVTPVSLVLPGWDASRIGQRISFISDFAAAVFNASVSNGGVITGTTLTSLIANTWYEYACKSITGTVATWKRIR